MNETVSPSGLLMRLAPGAFVLLWSTGFIGAKFGLPYAGPFTFLSLRMAVAVAGLGVVALYWRTPWPKSSIRTLHIAIAGLLVHGVYLRRDDLSTHLKPLQEGLEAMRDDIRDLTGILREHKGKV